MSPESRTFREGLAVGVIAYAAVAAFYALFDLLASRGALYTLDMLGKAVFRGLRDPGGLGLPQAPDPTAMFWYNALHLALALAIGQIVMQLVDRAERRPEQGPLMLGVIVAGFVATVLAVGALTGPMRPVLPWWSIVTANALATLLAGLYVLQRHPGIWRRLTAGAVQLRPGHR